MKPNVLLITTHDTGRHFGCYGIDTVHTPNIDTLASQGVRMTNMFATVPICCASRASMMTGRYPQSHGLMDLCFPPFNWALHDDEEHLSHLLHDAGYETHLFGIQHEVQDLNRLKFDDTHDETRRNPCDVVAAAVGEFLTQRANDGAGRNDAAPFYAQVGFFETHSPFTWGGAQPDDSKGLFIPPYLVPSQPIERMIREFQGMIRKADEAIGVILEAMEQSSLADDTIVIFTTDHGIEFPRAKWTLYDPGIEIAMIFRWPAGGISGGRDCDWLQGNVDFLPTILDLAGLQPSERVQGVSFADGLRDGANAQAPRDAVFGLYAKRCQGRSIRTVRYKLIRNFDIDRWYSKPVDITNPADYWVSPNVELYDLHDDPHEFNNVAEKPEYSAVRRELDTRLVAWLREVDDPILRGPLRTPFYEKSLRQVLEVESDREQIQ